MLLARATLLLPCPLILMEGLCAQVAEDEQHMPLLPAGAANMQQRNGTTEEEATRDREWR